MSFHLIILKRLRARVTKLGTRYTVFRQASWCVCPGQGRSGIKQARARVALSERHCLLSSSVNQEDVRALAFARGRSPLTRVPLLAELSAADDAALSVRLTLAAAVDVAAAVRSRSVAAVTSATFLSSASDARGLADVAAAALGAQPIPVGSGGARRRRVLVVPPDSAEL